MTNTPVKIDNELMIIHIRTMNTPKEIFNTLDLILKNMEFGKRSKPLNLFIKKLEEYFLFEQTTKNILDIINAKKPENFEIEDFFTLLKIMNPCKDYTDYLYLLSCLSRNEKYRNKY